MSATLKRTNASLGPDDVPVLAPPTKKMRADDAEDTCAFLLLCDRETARVLQDKVKLALEIEDEEADDSFSDGEDVVEAEDSDASFDSSSSGAVATKQRPRRRCAAPTLEKMQTSAVAAHRSKRGQAEPESEEEEEEEEEGEAASSDSFIDVEASEDDRASVDMSRSGSSSSSANDEDARRQRIVATVLVKVAVRRFDPERNGLIWTMAYHDAIADLRKVSTEYRSCRRLIDVLLHVHTDDDGATVTFTPVSALTDIPDDTMVVCAPYVPLVSEVVAKDVVVD